MQTYATLILSHGWKADHTNYISADRCFMILDLQPRSQSRFPNEVVRFILMCYCDKTGWAMKMDSPVSYITWQKSILFKVAENSSSTFQDLQFDGLL